MVFEIFTPKADAEVARGSVTRAKATCLCCGTTLSPDRVRLQLTAQRGGADTIFDAKGQRIAGARLLAVVVLRPGEQGRHYRLPMQHDYHVVHNAQVAVAKLRGKKFGDNLSMFPDEPLPAIGTLGFRVQRYGVIEWGDLFSARQKMSLLFLTQRIASQNDAQIRDLLGLLLSRVADRNSAQCTWRYQADQEKVEHVFARMALPPVWDFAEAVVTSDATGSWSDGLEVLATAVERLASTLDEPGQVTLSDAAQSSLPSETAAVWFTDPPYYDAVAYADLSDFFFVWLKRGLRQHPFLRDPFDPDNPLTPKHAEAVQDETKTISGRPKDRVFFEEAMARAFAEGRRIMKEDGIASIVFAHKSTEGWEALLSGMTKSRWVITASWPITTEMGTRLRARESAALATSVHLVCRPRIEDKIGDWAEVLRELPGRVADWMVRLEREGVRGADLVFACIGPALEIFSRYSRAETADGREVPLGGDPEARDPAKRGYLAYVWEVVGRAALQQVLGTAEAQARNGGAGALEEDARLTALFLWTIKSTAAGNGTEENEGDEDDDIENDDEETGGGQRATKGFSLVYDIVRRFAQPLGIHLDAWKDRIIEIDKGVVRLLPVAGQLFGKKGAAGLAARIERSPDSALQLELFPESTAPKVKGKAKRRQTAALSRACPFRLQLSTAFTRACCSKPTAGQALCARCS